MVHHAHRHRFTQLRQLVIRHPVRPFQDDDLFGVNRYQFSDIAVAVPVNQGIAVPLKPQHALLLFVILKAGVLSVRLGVDYIVQGMIRCPAPTAFFVALIKLDGQLGDGFGKERYAGAYGPNPHCRFRRNQHAR